MDDKEITSGGSRVYRHEPRKVPFELATGDPDLIDAVSDHIERHIGKVDTVFHEIISDLVHIDVHWVKPTSDRPFHTLITSGMSEAPMNVPTDVNESGYEPSWAELMVTLPADWPLSEKAFEDENNYWPIRWLKIVANLPHEYDTWIGFGHTIPNGDPPEPIADRTPFSGVIVLPSALADEDFWQLKVNADKTVEFFALMPLFAEEMNHKLTKGTESLLDRFDKHGILDLVDPNRKNVCKKRFGFF